MSVFVRGLLVAAMFALLSSPPALQRWMGGDTGAYVFATVVMAATMGALAAGWMREPPKRPARAGHSVWTTAGCGAIAASLLIIAARSWVHEILSFPIDPYRGDMLVVVREGLRRVFVGLNPYTIYHVPWAAPLPYGPLLWGPYSLPLAMRIDLRFLTVAGELFIPTACAIAAVVSEARGRHRVAAAALVMLGAIALNNDLARFTSIGHTPVYWALIALFAWLVACERWNAAAISLGLLVASRTTMAAIVPVLLMTVWVRDRPRFGAALMFVVLTAALPLLPFAMWNPNALVYALYGSYETVIKTAVWPDRTVPHTIGLTGVLLTHHLHQFVELIQLLVMAAVYAGCWVLLRRGRAPIALMCAALLAFSMTTLWPVTYIYFDVLLLAAAGALADAPWLSLQWSTSRVLRAWAVTALATLLLVAATSFAMLRRYGDAPASVTWRDRHIASVTLLRRTASAAFLDIQIAGAGNPQRVNVVLNGAPLAPVDDAGGDHLVIPVPGSAWQLGLNALDLSTESPIAIKDVTVRPAR